MAFWETGLVLCAGYKVFELTICLRLGIKPGSRNSGQPAKAH